jgi:uncharacterized protein
MRPLAELPELGLGAGQAIVRLPPMHNAVLSARVAAVVDHPAFQRLRQVRQLGPTNLVYPGATHTRFEHSLGVFHTAGHYLRHLQQVPAFADRVGADDALAVLAAALLHDIGHYPMAHSLEALHLKGNDTPRHEDVAALIIRGELEQWRGARSIASILADDWGIDPERVIRLVVQKPSAQEADVDALIGSIVSSGLDADKMDYLERDSLHLGVPYGRSYDRGRLLGSLTVRSDGRSIAITSKGKTPAEVFLFGRYTMFSEAYWHHTVRSVSAMVEAALSDLQSRGILGTSDERLEELLARSDDEMLEWLWTLAPDASIASALLGGITHHNRRLHKRVFTLSRIFDDAMYADAYQTVMALGATGIQDLTARLRAEMASHFGLHMKDGDVVVDTPPRDKDTLEDVEVVFPAMAQGRRAPLTQVSGLVQGIATDFLRVVKKTRVFVAPPFAGPLRARQAETEALILRVIAG